MILTQRAWMAVAIQLKCRDHRETAQFIAAQARLKPIEPHEHVNVHLSETQFKRVCEVLTGLGVDPRTRTDLLHGACLCGHGPERHDTNDYSCDACTCHGYLDADVPADPEPAADPEPEPEYAAA